MLKVEDLESGYGAMQVLWGPSLHVAEGSITALLGPNGVGKTTLLRTVFGLTDPWKGRITYAGQEVTHLPTHKKVGLGMVLVPEGKHLFSGMNVQGNLIMGAYLKQALAHMEESLALVYTLFPVLKDRAQQKAGSLSGGEQQMLTIARALMTRPRLIMLDEPSQGLSPKIVGEVFRTIRRLRTEMGLTILLVEQDVKASLAASDMVYILHEGRIRAHGKPGELEQSREIREAYLGM
ncbi:MAG TPA: ABC transporter ATP-binding protein [Candidatus Methylomirabilis sp.]|nr:ABC transporter ATP-binding protein [Candidatus Methylomirabilis sp.]HSB77545.1 ABC transporter ATP-binding protein [Candidatus Methylomirabilis sp.]HSC70680.1 ABC transporter ATP-binding protein [Candidatus Methylomirabilis sp.]